MIFVLSGCRTSLQAARRSCSPLHNTCAAGQLRSASVSSPSSCRSAATTTSSMPWLTSCSKSDVSAVNRWSGRLSDRHPLERAPLLWPAQTGGCAGYGGQTQWGSATSFRKARALTSKRPMRCAIYTRKSTEHGLELEFNSLQAQREACEAYVKSQAQEGWRALSARYDDPAYSGGSPRTPCPAAAPHGHRVRQD